MLIWRLLKTYPFEVAVLAVGVTAAIYAWPLINGLAAVGYAVLALGSVAAAS